MRRLIGLSVTIVMSLSLMACVPTAEPEENNESQKNAEEISALTKELAELKKELTKVEEDKEDEKKEAETKEEPEVDNIAPHSEDEQGAEETYKKHAGRFFDIEYPESFSILSEETGLFPDNELYPGTDGVTVLSPDKKVEFYVFSPLCKGDAKWKTAQAGEKKGSETSTGTEDNIITRASISGPGYARFYEEQTGEYDDSCIRVFGLKYTNAADYEPFKTAYLHFKSSLVQYWWD